MSLPLCRLLVPTYIVFRTQHSRGCAQVFTLAVAPFFTLSCFNPILELPVLIGQFIKEVFVHLNDFTHLTLFPQQFIVASLHLALLFAHVSEGIILGHDLYLQLLYFKGRLLQLVFVALVLAK